VALAQIVRGGLDPFRESLWLASLTYIADTCAALRDEAAAEIVYPELAALAGTNVMIGQLVACYGSVERYLGMLAATLNDWDRSEQHFETAMEQNRRMDTSTWLAHTAYQYARLLLARSNPEPQRAAELLSTASRIARQNGLKSLQRLIDALDIPVVSTGPPDQLSPREVQILGLVARGLTNREIGASVFISEHTVAKHVSNILAKTGCSNRTDAATYAHRRGLVAEH
jgi:DNA-binding CsgD family transcriptional regulator